MTTTKQSDTEVEFITEALLAEAEAIQRLCRRVAEDDRDAWRSALDLLEKCDGHVVVSGMGKSGLVGAKISATLSSLGQPSNVLHPAEAAHGDLGRVGPKDVVMLLSFSGETEEVVNLAALLQATGGSSTTHSILDLRFWILDCLRAQKHPKSEI